MDGSIKKKKKVHKYARPPFSPSPHQSQMFFDTLFFRPGNILTEIV